MKIHRYRNIQIVAGILILAATVSSCEEFFDEAPGDKITPEQHYRTGIDANSSTSGAYSILQEVMPDLIIVNDLRSDLLTETGNFDTDIRGVNRHEITASNEYNDPSGYYRIILNANEALNNLEGIQEYDRDFDSIALTYATVDMISLRTWAYFTLVRLYGEAAYIPPDMNTYDESFQFEYYSKDRMIDTLLSHLDSTVTYPDRYVESDLEHSKLIYDRALRGELYLEKGDYQNASLCFINAIGDADIRSRFKMDDFEDEDWKNIFVNAAEQISEVMSAIPYAYEDNQDNPLSDIFYADREYLARPSDYITDLFSAQETQENSIGDTYRGAGISFDTIGERIVVNKYGIDPNEFSGADIIIYRAADIFLLLAEALNQMGEFDAALSILNDGYTDPPGWRRINGIRNRVLLAEREMPRSDVMNAIEDMIMEERAMELAFEGKRWFDLVRVANRRGESYLADKIAAKYDDAAVASSVHDKLMDKSNWYLPFIK